MLGRGAFAGLVVVAALAVAPAAQAAYEAIEVCQGAAPCKEYPVESAGSPVSLGTLQGVLSTACGLVRPGVSAPPVRVCSDQPTGPCLSGATIAQIDDVLGLKTRLVGCRGDAAYITVHLTP